MEVDFDLTKGEWVLPKSIPVVFRYKKFVPRENESLVDVLRGLDRWFPFPDNFHGAAGIEWEKDQVHGDWVKWEDIEKLLATRESEL